MKTNLLSVLAWLLILPFQTNAFCGFYVAKADASIFNNKSQVILARRGESTVVTMSSDFKGNVSDFAMVVPVPTLLERNQIRVVNGAIFSVLDSYSAPRIASYYDENPCQLNLIQDVMEDYPSAALKSENEIASVRRSAKRNGVTIEARYEVEEYDVLILSAKESSGLQTWLQQNDYKIPARASHVLKPYIESGMKFFVVKVNLNRFNGFKEGAYNELRPIQIQFNSPKFMLPIRLGMANSSGEQDMIVYGLSSSGRIETTNYRTEKVPTDREVPLFIQNHFSSFYADLFSTAHKRNGENAVFLEYAWDATPNWGVKCDPCVGNPPMYEQLVEAGARWLGSGNPNSAGRNGMSAQNSGVFFTRLHVRYSLDDFPQDLFFQETTNTEQFQCRYVIHYPAEGDLSCAEGKRYKNMLNMRKTKEMQQLYSLTGWDLSPYQSYYRNNHFSPQRVGEKSKQGHVIPIGRGFNDPGDGMGQRLLLIVSLLSFIVLIIQLHKIKPLQVKPRKA